MRSSSRRVSDVPTMRSQWLPEPLLSFAEGNLHADPKVGIPLYGPRSWRTSRHKSEIHLGFIGTAEAIENAQKFYLDCAEGIDGDEDHAPFPGCTESRGFRCNLRLNDRINEKITRQESQEILAITNSRKRFEAIVSLLDLKMALLVERDHPLDQIVLVLPPDLYRSCRTVDYKEKGDLIHRDLRRIVKVMAMKHKTPVQILQESTTGLTDVRRKLDHPSRIAWNLFTGLYFKADGLPWGPTGLQPATCVIGISFFRPFEGQPSALRSSVVQAFDENGEGLILRGHNFHWDEKRDGKSPHLTGELASELIEMVLQRYKQERGHLPQRVVVHKTSRYTDAEREGFETSLSSQVTQYDLVAIRPDSDVRLLRTGQYPPLRGTSFSVGSISYLYTTGYLRELAGYPHGHVPSPLQLADHIGDTPRADLMREILALTKMNWNSANYAGLLPITLRFSRLVGDILREVPADMAPSPKFKFYM